MRASDPQRTAFYLTSRGITNEIYYVAQKAARLLGTNHVDNSARLCHAASTVAMKETLGHGASTCSYTDWLDADLIVFFGSNTPNNQPVTTKYLHEATRRGAQIAVVNTFREPGLERYWVPSIASSALFGTRLADHWFDVHTGGDLAFLIGVLRALLELEAGGDATRSTAPSSSSRPRGSRARATPHCAADWAALEAESGAGAEDMRRFARLLVDRARTPCSSGRWASRSTRTASTPIRALLNVGLARGLPGRPHRGLMPIRGHSGVQGGAEVGCVPGIDAATRDTWTRAWGFAPPTHARLHRGRDGRPRRRRGDVDLFWIVGGNFLETLADARSHATALPRPALRIHQDIVVVLGHARRAVRHGAAPAGDDALRVAGRRHRDDDRATDRLLAGDSRSPDRIGAPRVGRCFAKR